MFNLLPVSAQIFLANKAPLTHLICVIFGITEWPEPVPSSVHPADYMVLPSSGQTKLSTIGAPIMPLNSLHQNDRIQNWCNNDDGHAS